MRSGPSTGSHDSRFDCASLLQTLEGAAIEDYKLGKPALASGPLVGALQLTSAPPKRVKRQDSSNVSAQAVSMRKRKEASNCHQLREEAAEEARLSEWIVKRASLQLQPPLVSASERMENLKRRIADKAAAARKIAKTIV